jgi:hypothetical protein
VIDEFRGGLAFDADDAAIGMIVVGIEARHPAVLDGGDGGAVAVQSAITRTVWVEFRDS